MAIQQDLKAFWWLVDDQLAGMARPGFNRFHWNDLTLTEAVLLGWLGKRDLGILPLCDFYTFMDIYGGRIARFYGLTPEQAHDRLTVLRDKTVLLHELDLLNHKASIIESAAVSGADDQMKLEVTPNHNRLRHELEVLRRHNVAVVVSLIEEPADANVVSEYFEHHHFSIPDLGIPAREQMERYADVLGAAARDGKAVVTHCLAGIGRTTTMLAAAQLLHGRSWEQVSAMVRERNPHYSLTSNQALMLKELAETVSGRREATELASTCD